MKKARSNRWLNYVAPLALAFPVGVIILLTTSVITEKHHPVAAPIEPPFILGSDTSPLPEAITASHVPDVDHKERTAMNTRYANYVTEGMAGGACLVDASDSYRRQSAEGAKRGKGKRATTLDMLPHALEACRKHPMSPLNTLKGGMEFLLGFITSEGQGAVVGIERIMIPRFDSPPPAYLSICNLTRLGSMRFADCMKARDDANLLWWQWALAQEKHYRQARAIVADKIAMVKDHAPTTAMTDIRGSIVTAIKNLLTLHVTQVLFLGVWTDGQQDPQKPVWKVVVQGKRRKRVNAYWSTCPIVTGFDNTPITFFLTRPTTALGAKDAKNTQILSQWETFMHACNARFEYVPFAPPISDLSRAL